VSAEEALARAEELMARLEDVRARLEQTDDPDAALDLLGEIANLARDIQAEIERAKGETDATA